MEPKYPDIEVQLSGADGNAMFIMSRVGRALKTAGVSREEIDKFYEEAKSGDYDHVLRTVMDWVETY